MIVHQPLNPNLFKIFDIGNAIAKITSKIMIICHILSGPIVESPFVTGR